MRLFEVCFWQLNDKEKTTFLLGNIYPSYRNHRIMRLEEIEINIYMRTGNKEEQEVCPYSNDCKMTVHVDCKTNQI